MIIVGSKALEHFNLNRGVPKDMDRWYVNSLSDKKEDDVVIPEDIYNMVEVVNGYATPDSVYTIKCSHLAWDIKWEKTKNDILWLKAKGCKLAPELYTALKKHWETVHGDKSFLSLNKNVDKFFDDHVTYVYDHDYLHELVSHPNKPMYTNVLKSNNEVLTDRNKFDNLCFDDQVRLFKEEIAVIAVERWLVNPVWFDKVGWYQAWGLSLKKVMISLTKGWACDFIVCNLEHFVKPDFSYFKFINSELELNMSDVNTKPIEVFLEKLSDENELTDRTLVSLADGDLDDIEFTGVCEWGNEGFSWDKYYSQRDDKLSSLDYEHIMQEGGGEGGSEYCEGVFRLGDKHYKVSWSYYSHHGYETDGALDTLKIVMPKEKTVVVYE